ncbi:Sodium/potassium-transporting ATPase subunit like protein [Argiope bruennichi]|uniref:Sodium/potassium-transporting ATPase subunit like protein n=1 Tax=Argiope bruennichi TaxID=94029 RepID=A0A8T0EWL8_ARGBR|nr:Sodium/potassium-transporting ATPase subunit like protein [Argiope bruennichi]
MDDEKKKDIKNSMTKTEKKKDIENSMTETEKKKDIENSMTKTEKKKDIENSMTKTEKKKDIENSMTKTEKKKDIENSMTKTEKNKKSESIGKIWNSNTGECLGRTGLSWMKILIFYIIFFTCLIAFWACIMFMFFMTLDHQEPKYKMDGSRIGSNPGLGFRPTPPYDAIHSTVIWFNVSRNETIEYWVSNLNKFLEAYNQSNLTTCLGNETATPGKACLFPIPTGNHSCTSERQFGYPEGKPCVLIKLNKIYGWIPVPYESPPVNLRRKLKSAFLKGRVYVTCEGANPSDHDNIGEVTYYPNQGISMLYYPFVNQKNYLSPFVFVQFLDITRGVLVKIECRAWAENIEYNKQDKSGGVHFQLLVD